MQRFTQQVVLTQPLSGFEDPGGDIYMDDKIFSARAVSLGHPATAAALPESATDSVRPATARQRHRESQPVRRIAQQRRTARRTVPLRRDRLVLPDAGKGRHGPPLHRRIRSTTPARGAIPVAASISRVKRAFSPQLVERSSTTILSRGYARNGGRYRRGYAPPGARRPAATDSAARCVSRRKERPWSGQPRR